MERLADLFPELSVYDAERYRAISITRPTVMVAMTARTGSTHLCAALGKLLRAREPAEIFNPRGVVQWERQQRKVSNFRDYLASLERDAANYFLFKTNWLDFQVIAPYHTMLFPDLKIIYLDRIDVEAQAVSLFRAIISNRWHQRQDRGPPDPLVVDESLKDSFDIVRICEALTSLEGEKKNWEEFFFNEGIYPLRLNYEDFSEKIGKALRYIAVWLKVEFSDAVVPTDEYRKLADSLSEEWITKTKNYRSGRFYAEQKKAGVLP